LPRLIVEAEQVEQALGGGCGLAQPSSLSEYTQPVVWKGFLIALMGLSVIGVCAVWSRGHASDDRPHDIEISARASGNAIRLTQDVFGPESDSAPVMSETRLGLCRTGGSANECRMEWYAVRATARDTASAHSSGLLGVIGLISGESPETIEAKLQRARIHVMKLSATVPPREADTAATDSRALASVLLDLVNASLLADRSTSPLLNFRGSFNRGAHALGLQAACEAPPPAP
jgi:hypothetical protein